MPMLSVAQAAELLGVSDDTIRRWAEQGRLATQHLDNGRLGIDGAELARFAVQQRHDDDQVGPVVAQSARNRFPGIVTRVVRDDVMAQVDLVAGPFRVVSLMSREAADELALQPGVLAVAAVKATTVIVEVTEP